MGKRRKATTTYDWKLKARAVVKLKKKCCMFVPVFIFSTKLLQTV